MAPVHDPQVPGTAVQVPGTSPRYPRLGTGMTPSFLKMVASCLAKNVPIAKLGCFFSRLRRHTYFFAACGALPPTQGGGARIPNMAHTHCVHTGSTSRADVNVLTVLTLLLLHTRCLPVCTCLPKKIRALRRDLNLAPKLQFIYEDGTFLLLSPDGAASTRRPWFYQCGLHRQLDPWAGSVRVLLPKTNRSRATDPGCFYGCFFKPPPLSLGKDKS